MACLGLNERNSGMFLFIAISGMSDRTSSNRQLTVIFYMPSVMWKMLLSTILFLSLQGIHAQNATNDDCEDLEKGACFLVKDRPYLCYNENNKDQCCSTCQDLFTNKEGCEYGNRRKGCDKRWCPKDKKKIDPNCCWTCGGYTTTTSTTTTTTTTTTTEPPSTSTTELPSTTSIFSPIMPTRTIDIFTPVKYWKKPKDGIRLIKHGLNVAWNALKKTFFLDLDVKS